MTGCKFNGNIVGSTAGGIVGSNCGTVSNCDKLAGIVSDSGAHISPGGIIGIIYSSNGINFDSVVVSGNTFSMSATGQSWGIGEDRRLTPAAPSNNGTTPVI